MGGGKQTPPPPPAPTASSKSRQHAPCRCSHQRAVRVAGLLLVTVSLTLNVILWRKAGGVHLSLLSYDVFSSASSLPYFSRPTVDLGVGAADVSKSALDVTQADWRKAYEIAKARFVLRSSNDRTVRTAPSLKDLLGFGPGSGKRKQPILHLLRVPKGGSSYLSITARALAGCNHPGYPCCIKRHDKEFCPKENLFCGWIKGCVGHTSLKEPHDPMPRITSLRDPAGRLLSGFFYQEGSHNKHHKGCESWNCFSEYLKDGRVRDSVTKMLLGRSPYSPIRVQPSEMNEAKERLCGLSWFGMNDMPLASKLLLYELDPLFRRIEPHPVVFDLPPEDGGNIPVEEQHVRKNTNSTYSDFVTGEFVRRRGRDLIARLNPHEFDLYGFAWGLFCARVREAGLLGYRDEFESEHHFDECAKAKYEAATVKEYCPSATSSMMQLGSMVRNARRADNKEEMQEHARIQKNAKRGKKSRRKIAADEKSDSREKKRRKMEDE